MEIVVHASYCTEHISYAKMQTRGKKNKKPRYGTMFKKLISSLPFSPALVGQLGFYAKRLKKEEATRKMGLIFMALALVVQSFAVFQPPESANAASSGDFIYGGFSTREQFISAYDANSGNIKDLFTILGIKRTDLQNTTSGKWNSRTDGGYSWGRLGRFSYAQGQRSYTIPASGGGSTTFYYRPLSLSDTQTYTKQYGTTYNALIGKTASGMAFSLMNDCGNLILKVTPPPVPCPSGQTGTYPDCTIPPKMCTIAGKTNLLASDAGCKVTVMCTIVGKTNLPANDPGCVIPKMCTVTGKTGLLESDPACKLDPVILCQSLSIEKIASNYQLTTTAIASNGATIKGYQYTIKRDSQTVASPNISSSQASNIYVYNQSSEGNYSVQVSIDTSLGVKTSADCVKTFSIAPPEMCQQNPQILSISPECQPCPGDSLIWIKDEKCSADLVQTKVAKNISQNNVDAQTITAKANDKILYSLSIQNKGNASAEYTIVERIDDVAEYANVIDTGGGTRGSDPQTKTAILSWPTTTIKPGETITRMFTVQVMSSIPALAKGSSDPTSYDCRMANTFGNNVTIAVDCPTQKQIIETITTELPHTGRTTNVVIAGTVFALVAFLYARARQMKTEVRLIRRDFNAGTI